MRWVGWHAIRVHGLDLILVVLLLIDLGSGYRAGLVATVAALGGRIVAAVVAWKGAPLVTRQPWVAGWVPSVAAWLERLAAGRHLALGPAQAAAATADAFRVIAFIAIYGLVARLIAAAAWSATRAIQRVPVLGGANRLGGAALGLAVSAVELGLLAAFALVILTDLHAAGTVHWIDRSWLVTHLDGPGERAARGILQRWNAAAASGARTLGGVLGTPPGSAA